MLIFIEKYFSRAILKRMKLFFFTPFIFLILAELVHPVRPNFQISKQLTELNFPPEVLSLGSFGQKRLLASLMWIETLLESDLEHYKKKDYNSWMFLRFKSIAKLHPYFYENYLVGGLYLSVIKDDDLGAMEIYEKGLEVYPQDDRLLYYAGMHTLLELEDKKKALSFLLPLMERPKTPFQTKTLITKLLSENNQYDLGLLYLKDLLKMLPEGEWRNIILKRIKKIQELKEKYPDA